MSYLVLIKHALPNIDPQRPASEWTLSLKGQVASQALAAHLDEWPPAVVVASEEPKASETGRLLAEARKLPFVTAPGLHEQDRSQEPFEPDPDHFSQHIAHFFANPDEHVYGAESADDAYERFSAAVAGIMEQHTGQNVAIVAHGTVISLFASRRAGLEPFDLWRRLGLPSFVVLTWPTCEVQTIVEQIMD
jgi:broad specificity phosphatase PhoE